MSARTSWSESTIKMRAGIGPLCSRVELTVDSRNRSVVLSVRRIAYDRCRAAEACRLSFHRIGSGTPTRSHRPFTGTRHNGRGEPGAEATRLLGRGHAVPGFARPTPGGGGSKRRGVHRVQDGADPRSTRGGSGSGCSCSAGEAGRMGLPPRASVSRPRRVLLIERGHNCLRVRLLAAGEKTMLLVPE